MRTLTRKDKDRLSDLRDRGFTVVVFTPDELAGIDPDTLESELVTFGNHTLEALGNHENE